MNSSPFNLNETIEHTAHLLPAQGPIQQFVHHNPLHFLENKPFEDSVEEAARLFGTNPYLSEEAYRDLLKEGRFTEADLRHELETSLGASGKDELVPGITRLDWRLKWLVKGVPEVSPDSVDWWVRENILYAPGRGKNQSADESTETLWGLCLSHSGSGTTTESPLEAQWAFLRPRDRWLTLGNQDTDDWVHPLLQRFVAAYLDQGQAYWALPGKEKGLFLCFLDLYRSRSDFHPRPWLKGLPARIKDVLELTEGNPEMSLLADLTALGYGAGEMEKVLIASALAMRGWAGMIRQIEKRPDRVPLEAPPAKLLDFLALRWMLDRHASETLGDCRLCPAPKQGEVEQKRNQAAKAMAFLFFKLFRLHEVIPKRLEGLSDSAWQSLRGDTGSFNNWSRRRVFQLAYERRLKRRFHSALLATPVSTVPQPEIQAVFCLDEREESFRRHLEEQWPEAVTYGAAGFFNVAMYYRGIGEAHVRAQCPINIVPQHEVVEFEPPGGGKTLRRFFRRLSGEMLHHSRIGSRTLLRGTLWSLLAGGVAGIPIAVRIFVPRLAGAFQGLLGRLTGPPRLTEVALQRNPTPPSEGKWSGFTPVEMAEILYRQLSAIGLVKAFCPLVLIVGHGSTSLNNPQESAHDCGACSGGRGGPNARALAQMANRPDVRGLLAAKGIPIPDSTWFLGVQHNTCSEDLIWYDLDRVPAKLQPLLPKTQRIMDQARTLNAHERCRRFENAPLWLTPAMALAHVQERSEDLSQPRPEYGHATNVYSVVGRRERSRGLFMDRRAFLVSYDPETDDAEGTRLANMLEAFLPVIAGINLEYFFDFMDPTGYGCGTKLPHNPVSLLGVMDGHSSDLRPGLPWQMVEIHEPVRTILVLETTPETMKKILSARPGLRRLVENHWIHLALLDPHSPKLLEYEDSGFTAFQAEAGETIDLPKVKQSADWYRNHREHLNFARVLSTGGILS